MSKIVLFVCLVLGTVYANTQLSFVNARYHTSFAPGLVANLNDFRNVTTVQPSGFYGMADPATQIPNTQYITLPTYSFVYGEPITFSVVDMEVFGNPPYTAVASTDNSVTLVENQSYSFVYVDQSDDTTFDPVTSIPPKLLPFEERPNPSPYGKALLRIVNVAVSTYPASNLTVNVIVGTDNRTVSLPFGEASDFLEYDAAGTLTLEFTLPISTGSLDRTLSVSTTLDRTQVVYIRGDTGDSIHLGSLTRDIDFAFPAAPVTAPVAPPTAGPVSAPAVDTPTSPTSPTAPVAATTPTTPTARTPTKKVSSAAQTVAQIAGVAALASLLF